MPVIVHAQQPLSSGHGLLDELLEQVALLAVVVLVARLDSVGIGVGWTVLMMGAVPLMLEQ